MQAGLSLRFDRSPDYFALHEAHSPVHATWIVTRAGAIVSLASVVVRPAYVDGEIRKVAYFADLRQAGGRGLAGIWRTVASAVLDEIRREHGATYAYCSILRDNRLARASILESQLGRRLGFSPLQGYSNVSVVARFPRRPARKRDIEIRRAAPDDSEALRAFVDSQSRTLQFAPVFDRATWARRLTTWPDFDIGHFLIATDAGQRIVGCLAPWDSSRINRIVLDALPFRAEILRHAANALSSVTRRPRISVGSSSRLPDVALTHVYIANRNPDVLAQLLAVAWPALLGTRRYATVSMCLYDGDPLWRALRGTLRVAVPMDLYYLALDHGADPLIDSARWPGFESYLV